jgi:hypothetical protein
MTTPNLTLFTRLRSSTVGQATLFALGLLVAVSGYLLWQAVGAIVDFFVFGSGAGHTDEGLLVAAGFLCLHIGVLS